MELICNGFGIGCVLMAATTAGGFVAGGCGFGYMVCIGGTYLRMARYLFDTAEGWRREKRKALRNRRRGQKGVG